MEIADLLELDIEGSYLTLDSGFDSEANRVTIRGQGLIPVIYPNIRNLKDQGKIDYNGPTNSDRYMRWGYGTIDAS